MPPRAASRPHNGITCRAASRQAVPRSLRAGVLRAWPGVPRWYSGGWPSQQPPQIGAAEDEVDNAPPTWHRPRAAHFRCLRAAARRPHQLQPPGTACNEVRDGVLAANISRMPTPTALLCNALPHPDVCGFLSPFLTSWTSAQEVVHLPVFKDRLEIKCVYLYFVRAVLALRARMALHESDRCSRRHHDSTRRTARLLLLQVTVVMKFGGSSVADAERMAEVAHIVCSFPDHFPCVVLSAMGKVCPAQQPSDGLRLRRDIILQGKSLQTGCIFSETSSYKATSCSLQQHAHICCICTSGLSALR